MSNKVPKENEFFLLLQQGKQATEYVYQEILPITLEKIHTGIGNEFDF